MMRTRSSFTTHVSPTSTTKNSEDCQRHQRPDVVREAGRRTWSVMPNPARDQVWAQGIQPSDVIRVLDAGGREVPVAAWRQGAAVQFELGGLSMWHVPHCGDLAQWRDDNRTSRGAGVAGLSIC